MIGKRKKKELEEIKSCFGKLKEDPFDFERIEEYFRKKKNNSDSFQVISDKTCTDLDFNELFMVVDRTSSKIGQQYLYQKLRVIPSDENTNKRFEKLIEEFSINDEFRVQAQILLRKLNRREAFYISSIFQDEHLKKPKYFFIIPLLSTINLILLITSIFKPIALVAILFVLVINLVIHYFNKRNLYPYLGTIPQLLILNKTAKELYKNDKFKEVNPNVIDSIRTIDRIKPRMEFFQLETSLQGESEVILWGILELFKITFLLEPLLLYGIINLLIEKKEGVEDVFRFVGQIDTLISIASLRKGLPHYCHPTITSNDSKSIVAKNMYHPMIPYCVENSIEVNQKSILLTGSNMSGKSSFIRTIGINAITGLTLNTCFAEQFVIPRMRIYSAIRISDDLMNDRSYYFEEVLTIKEMIERSNHSTPNLFLLDEIFKGTNTVERISAGKAVLSSLAKNENIVFVSTHDIELADLLKEEYELYHFSEKVDDRTVDFDYKLKEGKLKNRNAIKILQINDYPDTIVKEAIEISEALDRQYS
jgi:Mismatch repair ATPase (MutS family)